MSDSKPGTALDPEHQRFEPFAGQFKAHVKMWMGPGEPFESTGTMHNALALGGRYLKQDYKGDQTDGPFPNFEGHGFWGFNTVTRKYEGFWIDSGSTFMQNEAGDVDDSGKVWNMVGPMIHPQTGLPMQKRSVITLTDNDHHSMELYFTTDDKEFKAMEIQYSRQG